jgi:hypothetical protein
MSKQDNKQNFNNGAFLISRSLFNSDIWFKPPEYLKIWLYLIGKANHKGRKYRGYFCDRGQCFTNYNELSKQLIYKIGYRNNAYNDFYMKNLMKYLRSSLMVTTAKKPRGLLITITNYDSYQNLSNYEKSSEDSSENSTYTPDELQSVPSINKNYKNYKNDKNLRNIYSQNSDEFRLAELLFNLIRERNPTHKKPNLQMWASIIDKMIRLDSRKADDIDAVIKWSQADLFWQNNVLSTQKLREKFDQLILRMETEKYGKSKASSKFTGLNEKNYNEGVF